MLHAASPPSALVVGILPHSSLVYAYVVLASFCTHPKMRRPRCKSSLLSVTTTLLFQQHPARTVFGFVLHRPPSGTSSSIITAAAFSETGSRVQPLLAKAKRSDNANGNDAGGMDNSALYTDLRQRIQELGLDGKSGNGPRGGGALAADEPPYGKGAEVDEEKEYVYIGGERFYLPSAPASAPTPSRSASREYDSSNSMVSSRRELIDEARPSIIGSLEGLALAISLFFVLTVAATGGSLFASNANVSTGSSASSQRVILDPDALLRDDFARDGSSIFYGQT